MHLESRGESCWSNHHLLTLDGNPVGSYRGRIFSEEIAVNLTGGRRYRLVRVGFWSASLELRDEEDRFLGGGSRSGAFRSSWDLELSCGAAQLVSAGIFNAAWHVRRGREILGGVVRTGFCGTGWVADGDDPLDATDLLLVGLVYRTIMRRRAAASSGNS